MELTRDDHPFIEDLAVGDCFDSHFVLRTMQIATTRANKPYLILDLTDRTGHIRAKLWDDAEAAYRALHEGDVVKVRAYVEEYLARPELKVLKIRRIAPEDVGDPARFLPTGPHDPEEDLQVVLDAVEAMEHEGLKKLLGVLLEDEAFREAFTLAPAGKRWHHAYVGGLVEHTASLVTLSLFMADHYPALDRDLLVAGAVLHDMGKVEELRWDTAIDYTARGRLLGHMVLGSQAVELVGRDIAELDQQTRTLLQHLILAHQGSHANGTPVEPMIREAFVLNYLDEIDSKLNAIERELTKAEGGGGAFTDYIRLLGRMLYKGGGFEELEEPGGEEEEAGG